MTVFGIRRIALITAVMLLGAAASAAPPRLLTAGIGLNVDTPQGRGMTMFADLVGRYSNGRLKVEVQTSGALGDDVKMVRALQAGVQDITCPDSSTLATFVKDFSAINYPFTFLNESEADAILDGPWGKGLLQRLPEHNLVGLSYWENGFRHLTNSKRPLSNLKQVDGVRMRVMQNPMLIDSFKAMGFDAVPMPFTQVFSALQSKEVDGQENPLPTILSSRFFEVQRHLTLSRHVYSAFVLLMSKKTWDSLNQEEKTAIERAAREARDFERGYNREVAAAALETLKKKGMQVTSIDVREAESVRRRLHDVFTKYNRDIGEGTVIEMYVALSRLRTSQITPRHDLGASSPSLR